MRGYEVVTSDDRVVGCVVDVQGDYLIVESGRLRRSRRPIPRQLVHAVDEAAKAFVTVPRRVLKDAPKVDRKGAFDHDEAARHYGLVESFDWPPTEGTEEPLPHTLSWGYDSEPSGRHGQPVEHRRAEIRKQMRPGYSEPHQPTQAALFGDRRLDRRRVDKDDRRADKDESR
jgi:hypothetical protein